jgi:hypothetical protein
MARWYRRAAFVLYPPFVERLVRADIEALFGWRHFRKGVAYIGPKHEEVFSSGDGVKEA